MVSLNYLIVLIQCQIFKVISSTLQKNKILSTNLHMHIYINRIYDSLVFKIEDRYKLELQTPETMIIYKNKKL